MAANVETMMFSGEIPWHGFGNQIDDTDIFDVEKGIKSAGLDWEVDLKNLQTVDGQPVDHRACYRRSDNRILGVVGPRWTPVQNWQMFAWFQEWLDAKMCALHTAGSLCNGQKIWVLAQIVDNPTMEIVKGDEVAKFILLSNSHDGTMAIRVGFTPIRVVCCNTLARAVADKASRLIRIRHSAKVSENMEVIKDIMNLANQEFEATAEQYRFLASKSIHAGDMRKYVKTVLGLAETNDSDIPTRSKNIMEDIFKLITDGVGQTNSLASGTYWAAYNGVNEYLTHYRGRNSNNRVDSLWFGPSAAMNSLALDTALAMAN